MKRYIRSTEDIMCMARVGWVPCNEPKCIEVYIHTNDSGKTPHFHVRKYSSHNQFEWEVCIAFTEAKYFKHGKYTDELPDKGIAKDLDKMLRTVDKKSKYGMTYWDIALEEWNRNNSDVELPLDLEQPDYTKLSGTV